VSTRCQVLVVSEGLAWKNEVMLYHHWDGYPTNMLPVIKKGKNIALKLSKERAERIKIEPIEVDTWELGRAGKSASFLCAADPGGFEPESEVALHGDIEWLYIVRCVNQEGGHIGDKCDWEVEVYKTDFGFSGEDAEMSLADSIAKRAKPVYPRTPIDELVSKAKEIEERVEAKYNE